MTIWILLSLLQFLGVLSSYPMRPQNSNAPSPHAPLYPTSQAPFYCFTPTSTMVNSRSQSAQALKAMQEAEEKRLQTKKTRLEEKQQAAEAAKAKAAIKAEAKRVEEANKRATAENSVSPDSTMMDQPDPDINNHLAAVNNPDVNINNNNKNNNTVLSSPRKNKQKTSHTKVKSALKNSNIDPLVNHQHKHCRILVRASIQLVGADEKERTHLNVMKMRELLGEFQSIDESTRLNHLYTLTKENIWKPEDISLNQTKFGGYCLISAYNNKNPFSKQRQQNNNKKKKNEDAVWVDPTIYLQFAISCDENPAYILDRVRSQWHFMGGKQLEVKEIQALKVFSTHVIWNMVSTNDPEAITYELRSMMDEVRKINIEEKNTDDPRPNQPIPGFSLSIKQPRLIGLNTKPYAKLSYEEQNHRRAIHIECAEKDVNFIRWLIHKIKNLCRFGEDKPLIVAMWGKHVLVSEVLESGKSSPGEIKNMNKMAQYHANYSTSMSQDTLKGVTSLDTKVVLVSNDELEFVLTVTLRDALFNWFAYPSDNAMEKEHRLFAEIHQGGNPGDSVSIVTPNTPAAENLIYYMNKNFAVILKAILTTQGLNEDTINKLLRTSVCPSHVAQMHNYTYDEKTRTLTSHKDDSHDKVLEDFAKAPWFETKFNIDVLLNDKKKSKEDRPPPELLYNIDGDRSLATIHDRNRKLITASSDPKKNSTISFDVDSSSASNKSEKDSSSSSSSTDEDDNSEGSTPSLSNARSNSTAPKVIESPLTLGNAQDSTMSG